MYENIKKTFLAPDSEYTLFPFWFWNDVLSKEEIDRQIHDFKDKGVDGFIIHPRLGIPKEIVYLSDDFMDYVKHAVQTAASLHMHVILYDEAMYPSGSAHGMVVKCDPTFASRGLRMEEGEGTLHFGETLVTHVTHANKKYAFIEGYTHGHIRGIHFGEDDGEPDAPPSTDLLNPKAVNTYIKLTHERYYEVLSEYFGNTIIAMFTDEPSIKGRDGDPRMQPWTHGFLQYYLDNGGKADYLPHLFMEIDAQTPAIRAHFQQTYTTLLGKVYFKTIYDWCTAHNIALAGHPGSSDEITLLQYFHIPGQDLIFRRVAPENDSALTGIESVQAKCSSDAARHSGRRRNMNECFACSGQYGEWSFHTDDMKWMMDWLFVRGVNMLVPHAFFYSLRDARKEERPPDVGPHNLWWQDYAKFAMYAKRMSYMLTDAVNQARIAVLCGAWDLPFRSVKPLYEKQTEFNYLDTDTFLRSEIRDGCIRVQKQKYTHLQIEDTSILTPAIAEKIDLFEKGGGIVSYETCDIVPDVTITPPNPNLRISHFLKDGVRFYLLVNEGDAPIAGKLTLPDAFTVEGWDAWNGTFTKVNLDAFCIERRASLFLCVTEQAETFCLSNFFVGGNEVTLSDWCTWQNMQTYSGTVVYETTFFAKADTEAILSLGKVENTVHIEVNGNTEGICLWAPYTCGIHLKKGENCIRIAVTNTLANRYGKKSLPSGLFGPVTLQIKKV